MGAFLQGASVRGEFENRLKLLLKFNLITYLVQLFCLLMKLILLLAPRVHQQLMQQIYLSLPVGNCVLQQRHGENMKKVF